MGDGIVRKHAIIINTSGRQQNVDDVSTLHRGLRSDGYRTLVASPRRPSLTTPTYFMSPGLSKIGNEVAKFASTIDDDDQLMIYIGGKTIAQFDCGRMKAMSLLVHQLESLKKTRNAVVLNGPESKSDGRSIRKSLEVAFGMDCNTVCRQANVLACTCIAAGRKTFSYMDIIYNTNVRRRNISHISNTFRRILNRKGCSAALRVLKDANNWRVEFNTIGLLAGINSYRGSTPIRSDMLARALMVVGRRIFTIYQEKRVNAEISGIFRKLLEQRAWDKALQVLGDADSWRDRMTAVALLAGINSYRGSTLIRSDVLAKAVMVVGRRRFCSSRNNRIAHEISGVIRKLLKQRAWTALKQVMEDAKSWTDEDNVFALTKTISAR